MDINRFIVVPNVCGSKFGVSLRTDHSLRKIGSSYLMNPRDLASSFPADASSFARSLFLLVPKSMPISLMKR